MTQMGEERGQQVRSRRGRDGDVSYSTRWHCVRGGNNLNSSASPGVMHAGKKKAELPPPPSSISAAAHGATAAGGRGGGTISSEEAPQSGGVSQF